VATDVSADVPPDRHASPQNAAAVRTQLVGVLTNWPVVFRSARAAIKLEMDEIFDADEAVTATVLPAIAKVELIAYVDHLRAGFRSDPVPLQRDIEGVHRLQLGHSSPGDYRVTIEGAGDSADFAEPVHGLLSVVDNDADELGDVPDVW
jgi:hypothetical protein